MKIGDSVVLRGTIKGVTYGEHGFPNYLVTLPNGCETEFPKPYIEDLKQLDEPQPIKIPQFVADVIEGAREQSPELEDALHYACSNGSQEFTEWYQKKSNRDLFARAWLTDYEAEKETKYRVKLKNTNDYLNETEVGFHFYNNWKNNKTFTRKELEYSDFSWVLDCPGIEMEEVE